MWLNVFDRIIFRITGWFGELAVAPLTRLPISPNQLTVFTFIFLMVPAAFFFTKGSYTWNLVGLAFILIHAVLDETDGKLARATGRTSILGQWLDPKLDLISSALILAALGFGFYRSNSSSLILLLILFSLFIHYAVQVVAMDYKWGKKDVFKGVVEGINGNRKAKLSDIIIKNFISLETILFAFFGTMRYFLFLTIIVNQLLIFFIAFAVFNFFRWVILLWAYAKALSKEESDREVIKVLKKHIG